MIVQVPKQLDANGQPILPDAANWGRAWVADTIVVGEYHGNEDLTPYSGEVYPPVGFYADRYMVFTSRELLATFTADEFDAIDTSQNATVLTLKRRLLVRDKTPIDARSQVYQSALDLLASEGLISADRREALRHGVPRASLIDGPR